MMNQHEPDTRVADLYTVLTQVLAAQEDERRAVTHVLREEIGQALAALALNLRVLEQRSGQPADANLFSDMRQMTARALRDLEQLQRCLYPPALESQGLVSALEVYIRDFVSLSQIGVELDAEVPPLRLAADVEITLFRIVQDALEHLRQQAGVSSVGLCLRLVKQHAYLVIEADCPADVTGWRVALIAERASASGGRCALTGGRFEVALPLAERNDAP